MTLRYELQRKSIHLSTTILPLAYLWLLDEEQIRFICVFIAIGFWLAELLRMHFSLAERYFLKVFSKLLREGEQRRKITGATYLFTGLALVVILYPKTAAIPAALFLTLADPAAAIAGRRLGSDQWMGKTIEGALAFYLTASAIVLVLTDYSWAGLFVALAAAIIEFLPLGLDDNILVPVISGYLFMVV